MKLRRVIHKYGNIPFLRLHFSRLWRPYLFTSFAVSSSMFIGDFICQQLEYQAAQRKLQQHSTGTATPTATDAKQHDRHVNEVTDNHRENSSMVYHTDWNRSYAMFMTGFFVSAPLGHTQQRIME
jgi:hypothetical protein